VDRAGRLGLADVTSSIGERYRSVLDRVAEAAARAGRQPSEVTIVVAAKTFGAAAVSAAVDAGARDVGENYVQEARRKAAELASSSIRWHLIGRLQRNKTRHALPLFHLIHSLDRIELARSLDAAASEVGTKARCLVEVNLGGEETKGGVSPAALRQFLEACGPLPRLEIVGLMTIPPPDTVDASRRRFAELRALRERSGDLRLPNVQLKELSMGMSADFEAAVEEGATLVRVGTAVFGPRLP
jgi:pyridoxal phosphate enzyme (YggS family)